MFFSGLINLQQTHNPVQNVDQLLSRASAIEIICWEGSHLIWIIGIDTFSYKTLWKYSDGTVMS